MQRPKSQTDDNKCSCTLLWKGSTPFSVMSPTTLCGNLFHTWTAVWMNVRPVETVRDTGTARAWLDIDMLERVALFLQHKAEEAEHVVYQAFSGVYFVETATAAT